MEASSSYSFHCHSALRHHRHLGQEQSGLSRQLHQYRAELAGIIHNLSKKKPTIFISNITLRVLIVATPLSSTTIARHIQQRSDGTVQELHVS